MAHGLSRGRKILSIIQSDEENHKAILENREKVSKWLDSMPIVYETGSIASENDVMIEPKRKIPKCVIENNVSSAVNDKIATNSENTMNVDDLLNLFDGNEYFEMNLAQPDEGKKCLSKLQLNDNEVSIDHPSEYIEEDQIVGESGTRKKRIGNQRKLNAVKRVSGKSYKTRTGKSVDEKVLLPNPCSEMKCQNKCGAIHDTLRKEIFDNFYALPSSQQKDFLVSCVVTHEKKRKYTENDISRRTCSKSYYLPIDGSSPKFVNNF